MLDLPVVKLPHELVQLLKMKLYNDRSSYTKVNDVISSNKALSSLVSNAFMEFSSEGNILNVLNTLGWSHFRDRLISVFLYKRAFGKFPDTTDIHLISDLTDLEEQLSPFSIDSISRSLLFIFYLKNVEYSRREDGERFDVSSVINEVQDFLSLGSGKNENIDWLIFNIWHFKEFYGIESLKSKLEEGSSYRDLFIELPEHSQKKLVDNAISYACSIYDSESFYSQKV